MGLYRVSHASIIYCSHIYIYICMYTYNCITSINMYELFKAFIVVFVLVGHGIHIALDLARPASPGLPIGYSVRSTEL